MTIAAGTRLGSFEVVAQIGAGGMGEVYRARDTRLNRIVAIKVLPAHLADKPELRERFEREARTVASLNHPHICVLHDIGQQDGTDYLVMEYLEGETLAERLKKGPLPLEQVLQHAIEIADALDKAHRKGVTHRDLKPGNIMLTKSGTKLLDFGLAKLQQEGSPGNVSISNLSTRENGITAQGTILGTLQYMAPEQVEGKAEQIDARTDIFSFGVVIYEMATGKKAFEGSSQASVIGAILKDDPPSISSLQPMTPPALDRVVKRCLAKDCEDRWQTARDVCEELKWISSSGSQAVVSTGLSSAKGISALGRRAMLVGAGTLVAAIAITGFAIWKLKPESLRPVTRTVINLPPGQQLAGLDVGLALALSPDGKHLAYVARQGGTQQIYLREMDSLESKPILGTEEGVSPFFSPDGQWVGFFSDTALKKIAIAGGAAQELDSAAVAPLGASASWGNHGGVAFVENNASPLRQVPEAGGAPQPLTHAEKGDISHRLPEFLPGDKAVLFAAARSGITFGNAQVAVESIGSGERRNLVQGGTNPRYALSGHLVYAQGGSLMAAPFDPQRLTLTGGAVRAVEGVLQSPTTGAAQYSISATGSLVYIPGGARTTQSKLVWVSRNGAEQPLAAPARPYRFPHLSPNGRQIAVTITEQESQTWLYDLARETLTRLTFGGSQNYNPVWTPDGKRIAFESNSTGPVNIFWQLADGNGGMERLTTSASINAPHSWSPDGQLLAFVEITGGAQAIQILRIRDRKTLPLHQTQFTEQEPRFSPDGRWLAYVSDESGRYEVYVQPYPGPGGKWQISTEGGTEPVWNPNGRELFYRNGDKMMVVEVATQPSFAGGTPRMLFEGHYETAPVPLHNFDISPDGQRFLVLKAAEQAEAAPTQIVVVQNWFEELKQKVPTGKK